MCVYGFQCSLQYSTTWVKIRYLQEPVQCLLVYYVNELLKNFKEMNSIWRNHLNHYRWQSRSASILRTSIRASQICINRFQIKDLCQDWNKEYLLQATFPSFVPPGECNNFVESLFSGVEGSQAGPESFGMKWCWEFPSIFRKPSDTRQGRGYHTSYILAELVQVRLCHF